MLSALLSAPGTMARHAGLYITVWVGVFLQALIAFFAADALNGLTQLGTLDASILTQDPGTILLAGSALLANVTISLFIFANVAHGIRVMEKKPVSAQGPSLIHLFQLSVFLILILAAAFVVGGYLFTLVRGSSGILQIILVLLLVILILKIFGGMILFSLAPTLLGMGFETKEALAQSWKITTQNIFSTILFMIGLLLITGGIQTLSEAALGTITNEWVVLLLASVFAGLSTFYSACAFSNAIPSPLSPSAPPSGRHSHSTKK